MPPIRHYLVPPYLLFLYNDGLIADGRVLLRYELYFESKLMFHGINYAPSPLHPLDSDECLADLLGFLSLRPGDTDIEYFKHFTIEQLNFVYEHGEHLAMLEEDLRVSCL